MVRVADIYSYLDGIAPFSSAMDFDNCGILVGGGDQEVKKALITLDITHEAVEEGRRIGAQLFVSHHPVIFSPLKRLSAKSVPYRLAEERMAAICAHTNLDMAAKGVNVCLARKLGLQNIRGSFSVQPGACILWEGDLPAPMEPKEFALNVKECLHCEAVEWKEGKETIRTVAVCSGAGAEYMAEIQTAQAFVTGEAKHHEWLEASDQAFTMVAAGHYFTEIVVLEPLAVLLREQFPSVEWKVFYGKAPFKVL